MGIRYILELSEEQAEIIKIALEEYFRLRMNQTWDFADSLCFEDSKENFAEDEFYSRIEQRDMFRDELQKLLDMVHPLQYGGGNFRKQTILMLRAQDIWQVIRYKLWTSKHTDAYNWCVDSRKPMCMTNEPLPKMERVE